MPYAAFASNFLWVMVIGLLGPSIPAMVLDLGISYAQAGFFFTLLSMGSLFGTSLGALATDYLDRKKLYSACILLLGIGLFALGFMPSYVFIALMIFLLSLFGSPIGAMGQSIMLDMFPAKREKYLSLQTFFAAIGSFLAPVIVSLNYTANLSWRWPFMETAAIAALLFILLLFIPISKVRVSHGRQKILTILKNRHVLICTILIFFSVATDLGFSYWLAEYFKSELHASLKVSSAVVSLYLIGIISGRLLITQLLKRMKSISIIKGGLVLSLASILVFILVPDIPVKLVACVLYGLGIGPLFPLLMARGVKEYPDQPGAVTGLLFGSMSLGGMVFPLLLGAIATSLGIERSYFLCGVVVVGIFMVLLFWDRKKEAG